MASHSGNSKGDDHFIYEYEYDVSSEEESSDVTKESSDSLPVFKPVQAKYNLALEYHKDAISKYDIDKRKQSQRGDGDVSKAKSISRFSKLHRDISSTKRQRFDFLRNMALNKLKNETFKMLTISHKLVECNEDTTILDLPEKLFTWEDENFIIRREMENVSWVDLLIQEKNNDCLNLLKFKIDMGELQKYMQKIFDNFLGESQEDHSTTVSNMLSAWKTLNRLNDISKEIAANQKIFFDLVNTLLKLRFHNVDAETLRHQQELKEKLLSLDVVDPIEMRYHLSYLKAKAEDVEAKTMAPVENLRKQINEYDKKLKTINYCSECTLSAYYNEAQDYKNRIEEWTMKFDTELEKIDNKLLETNLKIEKQRHQREFFEEEIERFHEDYELLKQKEIKERERQERLEQERKDKIAAKNAAKKAARQAKKAAELAKKRAIFNR